MYFFLESPKQTEVSSVHARKLVLRETLRGQRFGWLIRLLNRLLHESQIEANRALWTVSAGKWFREHFRVSSAAPEQSQLLPRVPQVHGRAKRLLDEIDQFRVECLSQLPVWRREGAVGDNLFKITLASQHAEPFDLCPAHADLQVRQSAQIRRGGQCDITTHSRLQRAINEYFSHDLEFSAGILTDFLGRVSTAATVLAID
jgi:hypothetical protein